MTVVKLSDVRENTNHNSTEYDRLNMEVKHMNGYYSFIVRKETVENQNGWQSVQFTVFADGNFRYTLTTGRKSQKKLDKFNGIVEEHKDELTELWHAGKYNDMCLLMALKAA